MSWRLHTYTYACIERLTKNKIIMWAPIEYRHSITIHHIVEKKLCGGRGWVGLSSWPSKYINNKWNENNMGNLVIYVC